MNRSPWISAAALAFFLGRWIDAEALALQAASSRQQQPLDFDGADGPNILDVLSEFPEPRPSLGSMLASRREGPKHVAICMTGHVRTFVLPGVHSSLVENVMHTVDHHGKVDLFMFAHTGDFGHTTQFFSGHAKDETSSDLQSALSFPGMNVKHKEFHKLGNCGDLQRQWKKEGIERDCPLSMQFGWMDRCIEMVQKDKTPYELIIMTRPDVGVFAPLPWANISRTQVNYMRRGNGAGEDWFFTIPMSAVDAYWGLAKERYRVASTHWWEVNKPYPDQFIFAKDKDQGELADKFRSLIKPLQFPAIIVRNETHADCARLLPMANGLPYLGMCRKDDNNEYWSTLHEG